MGKTQKFTFSTQKENCEPGDFADDCFYLIDHELKGPAHEEKFQAAAMGMNLSLTC
jgi:hypothetical protein